MAKTTTLTTLASAYNVSFLDSIKIRRSTVALAKESPISDDRIVLLVNHAIKYSPSPFHVQSCRAIVLFGAEHEKLWNIAYEECKKSLPPPAFAAFEPKIQGFHDAYGTVLFFEDSEASKKLPQPLQNVGSQNPEWDEHANGMNQFIVWTALCVEGLGCSLQHYHTYLTPAVHSTWNVPETWSLKAQLVFGKPTGPPRGGIDKQFAPIEGRTLVYGKQ